MNIKTAEQWFDFFDSKDLKECMLQSQCIPYNSLEFGLGIKKAIHKKKKNGEKVISQKIKFKIIEQETDPDIIAGTHKWISENIETGAGNGARQTIVKKEKI